ncbi:MAG: signal recognition particle receptor subunit alpha, partial [Spirochaetes bacterium]|nr:signal recognition particle receptor subunit alpha [Candidatus Ornithospirochaeta stercoravium]
MLFKRFGEKLKSLFGGRKIDEEFFDELEDTLIEGDLGARLTDEIITELRETARREKITEAGDLQARMKEILSGYIKPFETAPQHGKLNVYMILGVNGVGKTTTIAKMAKRYSKDGYKVLLAAGDTFRAAAVDQLDIHANRLGMRIVK